MPMYGENPWLDIQKQRQAEHEDWHVDFGPSLPKIPADATAAEMRELVAAHKMAGFVNKHLDDKEVCELLELLPDDERSFSLTVDNWAVSGTQDAGGWNCTAHNQNDDEATFKLPADLDKTQAEMEAARAIRERFGTNPEDELNDLSDGMIDILQRLSIDNPEKAIRLYMLNRLPADLAEEFGAAYDKAASNGQDEDLLSIVSDPLVSFANHEAVFYVFKWRTPQLTEALEPSFISFVDSNKGGRALSLPLLTYLFEEFQKQNSDGPTEKAPTEDELRNLSDAELASLYFKTRALAAQTGPRPVGVWK